MKKLWFIVSLASLCFFYKSVFAATQPTRIGVNGSFTGFETGDTSDLQAVSGTTVVSATTHRTGNYSFETNPVGAAAGSGRLTGYSNTGLPTRAQMNATTGYFMLYVKPVTVAGTLDEEFAVIGSTAATIKMQCRLNSARNIVTYDSTGVSMSTGTTVLSNQWWKVGIQAGTGAASGVWAVYVNDVLESSGTGNILAQPATELNVGKFSNINGKTVDYFFDDLVISSIGFITGDEATIALLPVSNGTNQKWSTSGCSQHFNCVNERPPNGVTSMLQSDNTLGDQESEYVSSASVLLRGKVINSVKGIDDMERTVAGSASAAEIISGVSVSSLAVAGLTAAFISYCIIQDTDPATGLSWSNTALDNVQMGAIEGSAGPALATNLTFMGIMVNYSPTPQTGIFNSKIYNAILR